jgi:lysophospholipase L1-like esterase
VTQPYFPTSPEPPVPPAPKGRRSRARDGILIVFVAALLLALFEGSSIRNAGEEMQPGLERELVLAVGEPAGWLSDRVPFDDWTDDALAFLEDEGVGDQGGFGTSGSAAGGRAVPPVPPDSFDPAEVGENAPAAPDLNTLLVTGDSLSMPLDAEVARQLAEGDGGVEVQRDPHVGTGISKSGLVDWGRLSTQQTRERKPDAVIVFIGANEGFSLPGPDGTELECCGREWSAEYAYRTRRMMNTYRRAGRARVYWLTLPAPRDDARQEIARSVNAAIEVAAQPYRAHVRVLQMDDLFTPGGRYRDAMTVAGRQEIVREGDGIHLNRTGADVAAGTVLDALREDFGEEVGG